MIEPKGIGRRVQLLRKRRGLTQAQVAEAVGVSLNYISNIETGRDICSLTVMTDVVNLLNASMDFILGESLEYNKSACESGDLRAALLHEIGPLSEKECGHLLNYLSLYQKMKTELQPGKEI